MGLKSERLRKLETELEDLEKWLTLGLVPKKDILKHKEEILSVKDRIQEERERLRFMKETGETEEYVAPKKAPSKQAYSEPQTLPEIEGGVETDFGVEETETFFTDTAFEEEASAEEGTVVEEEAEEEDPFSDKNRWKRGVLEDPDVDRW
ncbi:MAG: hypothetical protein HZB76_03990 [Chlamydiae bacterium]|nr:hypothetical protein [Chlamydiota bacterium]